MSLAAGRKTWGTKDAEALLRARAEAVADGQRPSGHPPGEADGEQMSPGDVVGNRYLLTSVLGEGGMGAIWLARDLKLDIDVALKFIHRDVATEETSERLLQEARAVARLDHPSIVRIFDIGEAETGEPFLSMEVLRGELLSEVIERKGRLAPPNAVCTLLPVASAVAAAHAKGIVHRDLKPENILLVTDESTGAVVPKVLDFGIAKLRSTGVKAKRITQNQAIVGTPDYMPPEQASGVGEVDPRADVWSLCVVLYEAITGKRPFDAPSAPMVLIAIATQAPTPTTELGAGDEALWHILERGLAKDPKNRFESMRELGSALARWAVDNGATTDVAGTSLAVHWLQERTRRPLSDLPPPPEEISVELPDDSVPPAAGAPAPGPTPDTSPVPAEPQRTGRTWPPRAVVRQSNLSSAALQALVEPVSLPPELEPGRRWRWVWWLLGAAAVGGAVYVARDPAAVRAAWESFVAPKPTEAPATEPPPATTSSSTPAKEPAAKPSAAPPPRPLPGRPGRGR